MLKGSNDQQLLKIGIRKETIVFYQIWQELVNSKTLDVYQYRIHTSLSIIEEMIQILDKTLAGLFVGNANIEACREEAIYILKRDPVMLQYYKPILNRVLHSLSKSLKESEEKKRLKYQLKYLRKNIKESYLENVLQSIYMGIQNGKIEDVELNANTAVGQAIHNGWSAQALEDLLRFFRDGELFELQWENFSSALLNTKRVRHDVLINIPLQRKKQSEQTKTLDALQELNLEMKNYDEIVRIFSDIKDIGQLLKSEKRYFHVSVEAYDIYTAAHLAIKDISEKLNIASFYNLLGAWDLSSVVIIPINSISKYHRSLTAEKIYQTYDYIDGSGKIFEYTQKIFLDDTKKEIREKLQGAFSYANISRASLFQEEKYMNLWVALESLARTGLHADIITNVKATVPAAVSIRYIYRVVRNYVEDCIRCCVKFDFSKINIDMHQNSKQKMVQETIKIFQDKEMYLELLRKSSIHSLLKYRTEKIHTLLTDVTVAKEKVENHYKHVEWQIQRLYRIRNEIAHAALQEQTSLIVYIEHLYDYLSTYISEILTCLCDKGQTSLEEALCSIKDNYDIFMEFEKEREYEILENTVLQTGIINLIGTNI